MLLQVAREARAHSALTWATQLTAEGVLRSIVASAGMEAGKERMADELAYKEEAAAEYDRAYSHVSAHFVPFLLRAARVAPGQRVLDVAAGTGIAAEAALAVVGPGGSIVAADFSPEMVEKARQRLGHASNTSVAVEDGQALSFPDESFDAVLCSVGLMFFRDPARGLSEFHRVLRLGGRAAVSVTTSPERSYNGKINFALARHVPSMGEATARSFSLGDEARLRSLWYHRHGASRRYRRFRESRRLAQNFAPAGSVLATYRL
jgi:ubiquinone/menaquinone biosynthesis C-methylase UbiE